jgi:hypothetical protein
VAESPITLRWFFFEQTPGANPTGALERAGALAAINDRASQIPGLPWSAVARAVGAKLDEVLDVNLAGIALSVWKKYQRLQEYRDPVRHPPEETALVPLAEHTIESVHRPHVDVLVNEAPVGRLDFEIRLALKLEGVVLKVRGGKIREIGAGRGRGQGHLKCAGVTLVERQTGNFELPLAIDLGDGLDIPAVP